MAPASKPRKPQTADAPQHVGFVATLTKVTATIVAITALIVAIKQLVKLAPSPAPELAPAPELPCATFELANPVDIPGRNNWTDLEFITNQANPDWQLQDPRTVVAKSAFRTFQFKATVEMGTTPSDFVFHIMRNTVPVIETPPASANTSRQLNGESEFSPGDKLRVRVTHSNNTQQVSGASLQICRKI